MFLGFTIKAQPLTLGCISTSHVCMQLFSCLPAVPGSKPNYQTSFLCFSLWFFQLGVHVEGLETRLTFDCISVDF